MTLYLYWLLFGFAILFISTCYHLFFSIRKSSINDFSHSKGSVLPAFFYSLTSGMSPLKKETAYLHFPTYLAGIIYHIGSFYSLLWIVFHLFEISQPYWLIQISIYFLFGTTLCGFGILLKRILNKKMRWISNPDDYFSNLLVSGFQLLSAFTLLHPSLTAYLYFYTGILFIYIPVGKLRHIIFFFIARFYLALFYGRRGVWPKRRRRKWQI